MHETQLSESDARTWALFTHLASFAGFVIPLGNIVGPIVVWQLKKDQSDFVDRHGKASVNFQISITIYFLVSIPLCLLVIGFVLIPILLLLDVVFTVNNMLRASNGEAAEYPFSIEFLK